MDASVEATTAGALALLARKGSADGAAASDGPNKAALAAALTTQPQQCKGSGMAEAPPTTPYLAAVQQQQQLETAEQQQRQQHPVSVVRLSAEPLGGAAAGQVLPSAEATAGAAAGQVLIPDLPDGEHHVRFADGSEYYGEFQGGTLHGRGVFLWANGDRYAGMWRAGFEDGVGTYLAADGSTYYGSWSGGRLDGPGVYKPVPAGDDSAEVVFMREYHGGVLASEQVLRVAQKDVRRRRKQRRAARKQAKQAYVPPKPGQRIYKGHASYGLMRELQLGIMFSIAQAGQGAAAGGAELRPRDFSSALVQYFPAGSETDAFAWKDYAPRAFHLLRQAFGIDNRDYLLSITGGAALRELPSPGKSGSVFFLSDDDRFIIKTVRREEERLLLSFIPRYVRHAVCNPATLLVHFYGAHRVAPLLGRRVRFVVMGNVLPSDRRLHRRYDLKGSSWRRTVGEARRASDPDATLKDLDLDMQLVLPAETYQRVMSQLEADCLLLEELHVMDYSLLLGVHFQRWGNFRWAPPSVPWPAKPPLAPGVKPSRRENGRAEPQQAQQTQQGQQGQQQQEGVAETTATEDEGDTPNAWMSPSIEEALAGAAGEGLNFSGDSEATPQAPAALWEGAHAEQRPAAAEGPAGSLDLQQRLERHLQQQQEQQAKLRPLLAAAAAAATGGGQPRGLHRTASEGVRGLLDMLQPSTTPCAEDALDSGMLRATAAALIKSADNSRRAAKKIALQVKSENASAATLTASPSIPSLRQSMAFPDGAAVGASAANGTAAAAAVTVQSEEPAAAQPHAGDGAGRNQQPACQPSSALERHSDTSSEGGWEPGERDAEERLAQQQQRRQQGQQQRRQRQRRQEGGLGAEAALCNGWERAEGAWSPHDPTPYAYPTLTDDSEPDQQGGGQRQQQGQQEQGQQEGERQGVGGRDGRAAWSEGVGGQQLGGLGSRPASQSRVLTAMPAGDVATEQRSSGDALPARTPSRQQTADPFPPPLPAAAAATVVGARPKVAAPKVAAVQQPQGGWACGIPAAGWFCGVREPAVLDEEAGGVEMPRRQVPRQPQPATQQQQQQEQQAGGSGSGGGLFVRTAAAAGGAAAVPAGLFVPGAALLQQAACFGCGGAAQVLEDSRGVDGDAMQRLSAPRGPVPGVGQGVHAMAVQRGSSSPPEPVLLYFGVIDFLQDYTVRKRLEHAVKSVVQDGSSVSVMDPKAYRKRFMRAMRALFVPAPPPQQAQQQGEGQQERQRLQQREGQ